MYVYIRDFKNIKMYVDVIIFNYLHVFTFDLKSIDEH